jgi:phosphoribulokinase
MSTKHPIIAITGSSGAGTTSVTRTFEKIFRRESVDAAIIEGDSFHRYDRLEMRGMMAAQDKGSFFSHFGPDTNLFEELAGLFRQYSQTGTGKHRKYLHDEEEAKPFGQEPGTFTPWEDLPADSDLLFYEGLHGAVATDTDTILRRMHDYVHYICPQFARTHVNFQRVPTVDTSNPFIAREIPTADESFVVIRFRDPRGIDFQYLLSMLHDSFMSRPNTIVVPGGKMELAMQLIFTPFVWRLVERRRKALVAA